ncbi:MAG: PAC2 family protein, partial [Acidimicrobiales bacterium]
AAAPELRRVQLGQRNNAGFTVQVVGFSTSREISSLQISLTAGAEVDRPLMVLALKGLFDAAEAATSAVDHLVRLYDGQQIAEIDPETFFNFMGHRPSVSLDSNGDRLISWPTTRGYAVRTGGDTSDLVVVSGVEPHLRWRTFTDALVELAHATNTVMVITIGAMAGMAPHTRTLGVVGSAANPAVADRLGLSRPSYQGPTGLVGALHDRLDAEGMPVVSLRVSVPHYVPGPPNAEATRSLLSRFELVTGVTTNHADLDEQASDWRRRIDAAVADDDELSSYVRHLEEQLDQAEVMPSGDDIAAELEAFLRDERDDGA